MSKTNVKRHGPTPSEALHRTLDPEVTEHRAADRVARLHMRAMHLATVRQGGVQ